MKAIMINNHGGLDSILVKDIPEPKCPNDKVKILIKASAINHLDIWVANGLPGIKMPLPLILGSDASGTVVEIGRNVTKIKVGDNIVIQPGTFNSNCKEVLNKRENYSSSYGILGETENGVHCKFVCLKPMNIAKKASHLSFEESASMQLVFMTAYEMIVARAKLKKNESILIYGATSGVGSAAIQIANDIGANVITTVGSKEKIKFAESLNPDYVIRHDNDNYYKKVKNITDNNGVDVVFEHIGIATWEQSMKVLSRGGRIVTCGATTGNRVDFDLRHLFMKQQSILGSTMASIESFNSVISKIKEKKYKPIIDQIYQYSDLKRAYARINNRNQYGKVILVP